jgi:hypothetical protein
VQVRKSNMNAAGGSPLVAGLQKTHPCPNRIEFLPILLLGPLGTFPVGALWVQPQHPSDVIVASKFAIPIIIRMNIIITRSNFYFKAYPACYPIKVS